MPAKDYSDLEDSIKLFLTQFASLVFANAVISKNVLTLCLCFLLCLFACNFCQIVHYLY